MSALASVPQSNTYSRRAGARLRCAATGIDARRTTARSAIRGRIARIIGRAPVVDEAVIGLDGCGEIERLVGPGRMPNFRLPPLRHETPMRFLPVGQRGALLFPVHHRRLIAPVEQFWHGTAMGARHHERAHGGFVAPDAPRPVPAMAV